MGNTVIPEQPAAADSMETRVHAAADALRSEGRKVTAEAVRQAIGGGSLRDICPALRRWRELTESPSEASSTTPPEVARIFRGAETRIWALAEARIAERVAAAEAAGTNKVAAAEMERDEALEDNERLERRLASLEQALVASREAERQASLQQARAEGERKGAQAQAESLAGLLEMERSKMAEAQRFSAELQGRFASMAELITKARETAALDTA